MFWERGTYKALKVAMLNKFHRNIEIVWIIKPAKELDKVMLVLRHQ